MDIKQIASHLTETLELPFGVKITGRTPNNYLGLPSEMESYIDVHVEDVCHPETHEFRSHARQRDVAKDVRSRIAMLLPGRCTTVQQRCFGDRNQYGNGVGFRVYPRFAMELGRVRITAGLAVR